MSIIEELEKTYLLLINNEDFIKQIDFSNISKEEIYQMCYSDSITNESAELIRNCWLDQDA